MSDEPVDKDIRCLHTESGREPSAQDAAAGERHWRCPARFRYAEDDADPPIRERAYCAAHRDLYLPHDRARPEEVRQAIEAHQRVATRLAMPDPREPWTFMRPCEG